MPAVPSCSEMPRRRPVPRPGRLSTGRSRPPRGPRRRSRQAPRKPAPCRARGCGWSRGRPRPWSASRKPGTRSLLRSGESARDLRPSLASAAHPLPTFSPDASGCAAPALRGSQPAHPFPRVGKHARHFVGVRRVPGIEDDEIADVRSVDVRVSPTLRVHALADVPTVNVLQHDVVL